MGAAVASLTRGQPGIPHSKYLSRVWLRSHSISLPKHKRRPELRSQDRRTVMSNRRSTVGLVMASCVALTVTAMAQSKDDRQLPTGDVWITPEHPYLFYLQPKAKAPIAGMALGDVWV